MTNDGDSVDLTGHSDGGTDASSDDGDQSGSDDDDDSGPPPDLIIHPVVGDDGTDVSLRTITGGDGDGGSVTCGAVVDCDPAEPTPPTTLSLDDIASFRPASPVQGMEPDGWAVAGLPANFFITAETETVAGTLLGFDVRVRFTPVGYHWSSSDGASASSSVGGASWAALGVPEFAPTPTSLTFTSIGRISVSASVDYAAEFSFGSQPWREIAGTLAVSANEIIVTAADAETVLVARNCVRNPSGPGC
ncbi:hypothetical protein [Leifsonia sp. Leaf264]|uniref:hypothetical protein n=1 Tax=Leifsonia sp. Leaf264 TaxID=1736314 RepID=UPI0006F54CAC|nr:hypothetical protein [Leifsonia sp. Leaf264]KQP01530.1 hypothetical protein ASF30_02650 [Leifsonia sp. Leaf264]